MTTGEKRVRLTLLGPRWDKHYEQTPEKEVSEVVGGPALKQSI